MRRVFVLAGLAVAVATSACGSATRGAGTYSPTTIAAGVTTTVKPGGVDLAPQDTGPCRSELATIATAMNTYRVMNGDYPKTLAELASGDSQVLQDPPSPARWTYSGGGPTGLVGVGRCTGVH